jgi:RNA polymerase sigma-70 factor (ECF subfamily)
LSGDISFDHIYDQLLPSVYRYVSARIPRNDTEDVTAEILAKVWRAYPHYQGRSSLKTWALRIAARHIADYYRALKRTLPVLPWEPAAEAEHDHSDNCLDLLSIGQALSQCSAEQVSAIQLRLVEGYSAVETAEILHMSPAGVDSLLYRAKQKFRTSYRAETTGGVSHV